MDGIVQQTRSMGDSTDEIAPEVTRYEAISAIVRLVLGLGALLGVVALLSWRFHAPLERFGHAFVARFGPLGVAGGSFLADGVHFPLPPQFYLLAGEAGGMPPVEALAAALVGSALGGFVAFAAARHLAAGERFAARVRTPKRLVGSLFAKHGYLGLALAATLPISYCILCALTGALRLPWRAYGVLAVMRVPRLLLSYAVIVAAWHHGG